MRRWWLLVALALGACGGSDEGDTLEDRACPEGSVLTWESFGAPFLQNWCTGCHSADVAGPSRYGAPEHVNFDTPASVRAWSEGIYARAADGNTCNPPVPGFLRSYRYRRRSRITSSVHTPVRMRASFVLIHPPCQVGS